MNNNENQNNNHEKIKKPNYLARRAGALTLAFLVGGGIFAAGHKIAEFTNDDVVSALNNPQAGSEITNTTEEHKETIFERLNEPLRFSEEVGEYSIGKGEGLFFVAAQVEGVGSVDPREVVSYILHMPQNAKTIPESGILQPGMVIYYPLTVEKK